MLKWDHTPDYVKRPLGPRRERDGKYDGFGFCIYCGATPADGLHEEHIIPKALGSHLAIRDASCTACEVVTHAFEGRALHSVLLHPRLHSKMKKSRPHSKMKKSRPQEIPVLVSDNGTETKASIKPGDYHVFGHFPVFLPARMILRIPPDPTGWSFVRVVVVEDADRLKRGSLSGKIFREAYTMHLADFARMVAKIAYCFTIATRLFNAMK